MSKLTGHWSYEEASRELDKFIEENNSKRVVVDSNPPSFLDPEVKCSICGHIGLNKHQNIGHSIEKTPLKKNDLDGHLKYSLDDSFISTTHDVSGKSHLSNRTPDSILLLEAKHSANSVIMAFRDLQNKAKVIEKERASAIRVREELRQELAESKRRLELARNKQEIRANDHYLSLKSSTEELMIGHSQLTATLNEKSDQLSRIQHQLLNQQAKQSLLESDRKKYKVDISGMNEKLTVLRSELINSSHRVESLEKRLKVDQTKEIYALSQQVERLLQSIEKDNIATIKADTRLAAMEKYLEIILKVNGDLCERLASQNETESRIARILEKQIDNDSKLRDKEIQLILESAESIGLNHALEISRHMRELVGPRIASNSPPRRRPSKETSHRAESLRKSISPGRYDTSVIEAAARMAATAAATSLVASQSTAHCSACPPKKKFIPTGSKSNKEFNVVATISKAAREAKNLNAKVASRVMSLDYNGTGSIYQDVNQTDLQDMHNYLKAMKKLHMSG